MLYSTIPVDILSPLYELHPDKDTTIQNEMRNTSLYNVICLLIIILLSILKNFKIVTSEWFNNEVKLCDFSKATKIVENLCSETPK